MQLADGRYVAGYPDVVDDDMTFPDGSGACGPPGTYLRLGLPTVPAMVDPPLQPDLWDRTAGDEASAFGDGGVGRA